MNVQNPLAFMENYKAVKARLLSPSFRAGFGKVDCKPPRGRKIYDLPIGPFKRDVLAIASKTHFPPMVLIAREVCNKHGVSLDDMRSSRRTKNLVVPRQEFFYRARHETKNSLPAIGRFLGGKDHTTVLHGVKRHAQRIVSGEAVL